MHGMIGRGFRRQDVERITRAEIRGEEDVVNAVIARHVHTRANLGRIGARPRVDINAVNQLIRLFVITQIEITERDHVGFILRARQK